jgi:hypothetical protein
VKLPGYLKAGCTFRLPQDRYPRGFGALERMLV